MMQLAGVHHLDKPPAQVWAALFDTETLAAAIPGCEALEQIDENSFAATVKLKIGPVSARFKGTVEISDINAPYSCTLSGKGNGGIAGFATGSAQVLLASEDDMTVLTYSAEAAVGGKLAALGNRMLKTTADRLANEFFANFAKLVSGHAEA